MFQGLELLLKQERASQPHAKPCPEASEPVMEDRIDATAEEHNDLGAQVDSGALLQNNLPRKDLEEYQPKDSEMLEEEEDYTVESEGTIQKGRHGSIQESIPSSDRGHIAAKEHIQPEHHGYKSASHGETSHQPPGGALQPNQLQPGINSHVAPAMAPDFDIDDEGYAESTTTSYVTSIASEISKGILENDRIYPQYGKHSYGMPVDEEEMDRMDLQHRKYEMVLGDRHFLAPIGETPQKILDLGTGTGIWALDLADMFPSAAVTGVDIAPIQPKWVAPNCQFEIDDVEADWTWKPNSFDFIHLRDPLYMIHDWSKLMRQIYDHLRPGGWCEIACIHPQPTSDDGSMPPDSGFKLICDKLMEASELFGTPLDAPQYRQRLSDNGFIDVTENIFKIPSSPWPKDKRLKRIGALEMMNVIAGATAFGLRAFERVFGWSKLQTEVAMLDFKRDVKNKHHHQYCQYFVVYGRKPIDPHSMDY